MLQYGMLLPIIGLIRKTVPGSTDDLVIIEAMLPALSLSGIDMITPLLVPIHRRFDEISSVEIRT